MDGQPAVSCNDACPLDAVVVSFPTIEMQQHIDGCYQMSVAELLAMHKETTDNCRAIMQKKNHDYTSGGSVFANFRATEFLDIHAVLGILIRSTDKFMRIKTYITQGGLAVEGEGVIDAIEDVINYMILAKGIILEDQRNAIVHN